MVPTHPPVPTGVRGCAAHELRLEAGPYQGAGGSVVGGLHLVNLSPEPCLIAGTFTLRFVTKSGMVALSASPGAVPLDGRSQNAPGWAVAGRAAIGWSAFWCRRDDPIVEARVDYAGATLTTPHGPWAGGRACDTSSAGALAAWPLGPVATTAPSPAPPALRPHIDAPASAASGEVLTFTVTLTNHSAHEVRLSPCPYYVAWLSGRVVATSTPPPGFPSGKPWEGRRTYAGAAKEAYSLNCADAPSIAAGASVTFEMRLGVPADALGRTELRWSLAGAGEVSALATLDVRPP